MAHLAASLAPVLGMAVAGWWWTGQSTGGSAMKGGGNRVWTIPTRSVERHRVDQLPRGRGNHAAGRRGGALPCTCINSEIAAVLEAAHEQSAAPKVIGSQRVEGSEQRISGRSRSPLRGLRSQHTERSLRTTGLLPESR